MYFGPYTPIPSIFRILPTSPKGEVFRPVTQSETGPNLGLTSLAMVVRCSLLRLSFDFWFYNLLYHSLIVPCTGVCFPNSLRVPKTVTHRSRHLVIAHRGASYHLPEHTLNAYRLALELGADFVEPDVVATKDGALIAMHTLDLNVTTNVVEIYPDREPWFSPTTNRSGYWTYNFTISEIEQLKVKQRLPEYRSTAYDFLFRVPRLEDIVDLVHQWNTNDLPARLSEKDASTTGLPGHPSELELHYSGIYAELKETRMLLNDAGIDLVDLFYKHFEDYEDRWKTFLPCYQNVLYDKYRVPGLVIQSFELEALSAFHERWGETFYNETEKAEPPYVILVDETLCSSEEFWYDFGLNERSFIEGIGCEKTCLQRRDDLTAVKAREFDKVLHPWTERPELKFTLPGFNDSRSELEYLLCTIGVQGLFSESVDEAVAAIAAGCSQNTKNKPIDDSKDQGAGSYCYDSSEEASAYVAVASFVIGGFVVAIVSVLMNRRQRQRVGRVIPPTERTYDLDELDLEMT